MWLLVGGTRSLYKYRTCTAGLSGEHGVVFYRAKSIDGIIWGMRHYFLNHAKDILQDLFHFMHFTSSSIIKFNCLT